MSHRYVSGDLQKDWNDPVDFRPLDRSQQRCYIWVRLSYKTINTVVPSYITKKNVKSVIALNDAAYGFPKERWFRSMLLGNLRWRRFLGRRLLQPNMRSWFVQYCACSCLPHCRRALVGDVKLVCLALWREREYLTFISIRVVAFSNQNFADYRS